MRKVRQLKNEREVREYLDDEEFKKLLGCFDRSYFPECRDAMVVTLIMDTGMRLEECVSLVVDNISTKTENIFCGCVRGGQFSVGRGGGKQTFLNRAD